MLLSPLSLFDTEYFFFFFFLIEDWKKVKSLIKARSKDSQFSIEFVSKRRIIVP